MMIRNDSELREAKARLADFRHQVQRIRDEQVPRSLNEDQVRVAIAPQESMADDIAWEVDLYERLKSGNVSAIPHYAPDERGKALICLRITKGWTQRQLAEALGVSEAVVSRDERNEYHGISMERYGKVLAALGFEDHPRFVGKDNDALPGRLQAMIIPFPNVWRAAASFVPPASTRIVDDHNHAR